MLLVSYLLTYSLTYIFELSQQQWMTSGLNTNFNLQVINSTSHYTTSLSFFFSLSQTTAQILSTISERKTRIKNKQTHFWGLFIFREHSTREPASSRVTYFILRAYTKTGVSHSNNGKTRERFWKKCR